MEAPINLAQAILTGMAQRGEAPVLVAAHLKLSGRAFAHIAWNMALHLGLRGIGRQSLVAIRSDDLIATLASILATGLLGCRWTLASTDDAAEADLLLDTVPEGQALLAGAVRLDESWAAPPALPVAARFPGPAGPDDIWLIFEPSAQAGGDALVGFDTRVLAARFRADAGLHDRPGKRIAGLLGPDDPAQLLLCLSALYHGATLIECARPEEWLAHAVDLVCATPATLAQCLGPTPTARKLADLRLWTNEVRQDEIDRALLSFDRVTCALGFIETGDALLVETTAGSGRRVRQPGGEVRIVDAAGQPLPPGMEGELWIRTDRMARILDPLSGEPVPASDGEWFQSGALGVMGADGAVSPSGRWADPAPTDGVSARLALLDLVLQAVDGVQDAIAFMLARDTGAERLTAILALEAGADMTRVLSEARIAALRIGGRAGVPARFLFGEKLPRQDDGSPDRAACAARVTRILTRRRLRAATAGHPLGAGKA
jgi:hypothetical protein